MGTGRREVPGMDLDVAWAHFLLLAKGVKLKVNSILSTFPVYPLKPQPCTQFILTTMMSKKLSPFCSLKTKNSTEEMFCLMLPGQFVANLLSQPCPHKASETAQAIGTYLSAANKPFRCVLTCYQCTIAA